MKFVTIIEDSYEKYGIAMASSIIKNDDLNRWIFYVDNNYLKKELEKKGFLVKPIPIQHPFFLNSKNHPVNHNSIWKRMWFFEKNFIDGDICYTDCDILVLNKLEIPNSFAITDMNIFNLKGKEYEMLNGGVLYIKEKHKNIELINDYYKEYKDYLEYSDQSLLSIIANDLNWCISKDLKHNFQTRFIWNNLDWKGVNLLHFSDRKPDTLNFLLWNYLKKDSLALSELWYHYLRTF